MWPSTVVRFAPIVTTEMWLPPASRHAAMSLGHWLSPRLYCWIDSNPNWLWSRPSAVSLASIFALICTAWVWVRPPNRNPSAILAARSNAASLAQPNRDLPFWPRQNTGSVDPVVGVRVIDHRLLPQLADQSDLLLLAL